MDLVDLMTEKRFVGQEFLVWLWFKSEERRNAIFLENSQTDITLVFEKHLVLESGEGDSYERTSCQGAQSELLEGRDALAHGKKVQEARMMLVRDDYEFHFTVTGNFEFKSVNLPKMAADGEDELDRTGRTLDLLGTYRTIHHTIDELLKMFLHRALQDEWPKEVKRMRAWIGRTAEAA